MESRRNRKWGTITLLCVILPISLLIALKSTGLMQGIMPIETVTVGPVVWSFQRPHVLPPATPRFSISNSYNDSTTTIQYEINGTYQIWSSVEPFSDNTLGCRAIINATVKSGHIVSVTLTCFESSNSSRVSNNFDYHYSNLIGVDRKSMTSDPIKAYIKTLGVNHPLSVSFSGGFLCTLGDLEKHELKATTEILCWTSSAYQKILLPIVLETYV